ncbi:hypothetical protein BU23DRAFT_486132, partial [Bimuria novae-zelandiae CBS 107.79]
IKYFNKYNKSLLKGVYYSLVLNRHESYKLIKFKIYYKAYNIIIISFPLYFILKRFYSYKINIFIKSYINYITKVKFFVAFYNTYIKTIIVKSILATFRGASLILYKF